MNRRKPRVIWEPFPGAQTNFLTCPAWECLLEGPRGGGKTDSLLMDYLRGVGRGYGEDYRGLLLREATTELGDVIAKSKKWIPRMFPTAKFNAQRKIWTFADGETLWFNYARVLADYDQYHGHEYSLLDTTHVLLPNNSTLPAKDIKVGDLVQTLQGPKKITKIFKYKKPAVRISVYDSYSNLIGSQVQGVLHPLLSNDVWQRQGLSYSLKTFLQQKSVLRQVKEVYKFLHGVDQEIFQVSLFSDTQISEIPILELLRVQNSCLNQIFQQSLYTIIHFCEGKGFHLYIDQENVLQQFFSSIQEIFYELLTHELQIVLQLLQYCVFLQIRVLQLHLNHAHQNRSKQYCSSDISSLLKKQKYLIQLHNTLLKIQNSLHTLEFSVPDFDRNVVNDILKDVLLDLHKVLNWKDDCLFCNNLYDGKLHPELISVLFLPQGSNDVPAHHRHKCTLLHVDFDYAHPYQRQVLHTVSQHFDNFCYDKLSFSVSSLESPVNMVDFEVQDANHYITELDYDQYHNRNIHKSQERKFLVNANCWIGYEELTNWAVPDIYLKLMSCNRTSNKKIKPKYRSTCNPSGPGHQWVKQRFIDPIPIGTILRDTQEISYPDERGEIVTKEITVTRTRVHSVTAENKALLEADPTYFAKLQSLTNDNEMLRKAWIDGSWDLIIGGFFTDVWEPEVHVISSNIGIPKGWSLDRSFDWGSSKPWGVTYAFESNGEQPTGDHRIPWIPKNSVIIPTELYGWTGVPNEGDRATSQEIAERVLAMDFALELEYGIKCHPGPADNAIWEVRDGSSIGNNLSSHGCRWTRSYKGPGSRIAGWAIIRQMLSAAKRGDFEKPHLYFMQKAQHHIRTLPLLQRDERNAEDVDSTMEDHLADSLRYRLSKKMVKMKRKKVGV